MSNSLVPADSVRRKFIRDLNFLDFVWTALQIQLSLLYFGELKINKLSSEVLHNSIGLSQLPKPSIFNPPVTSQEKTTTQS